MPATRERNVEQIYVEKHLKVIHHLQQCYLILLRYFGKRWKPFCELNDQLHRQYRYLGDVSEMGIPSVFFIVNILREKKAKIVNKSIFLERK